MKYVDGLNYLDQLKDYVQTSLSSKQNVETIKVEKRDYIIYTEEVVHSEQNRDPLSLNEKEKHGEADNIVEETDEEINNDENIEEVEPGAELDLISIHKEDITIQGD